VTFSLKQLGQLDYFLGFEIKCLCDQSILMTQTNNVRDLLHKTHGTDLFSEPILFRSVVGAFQYATLTWPKISFVVNKVY